MGCAYSQNGSNIFKRINDNNFLLPSNKLFKVINIDEQGNDVSLGKIEITYGELILHQKGKTLTKWPLRSLRRYGHDSHLFSFECGRRCLTGPGVYAFKCNKAEELFNVLRIAIENSSSNISEEHKINLQKDLNFSGLKSISQNVVNQSTNKLTNLKINPKFIADNEIVLKNHQNTSIFPHSHSYANDIREYINSPLYINTQNFSFNSKNDLNQILKNNENNSRKTNINFNYAKLEDLQAYVNLSNKNNTIYVNQPDNAVQSLHLYKNDNEEEKHKLNYTTLDLDNNCDNIANTVTTTSVTGLTNTSKTKYNEFDNNTNVSTILISKISDDENKSTPNVQPYSVIDFDKTKALSNSAAVHRKEFVH